MAENRLPRAFHKLIAHADHQTRACEKWQDAIGLVHHRADRLERAATNARAAETELRAAHAAWAAARSARQRADHETWDHIRLTRLALAPFLGQRWNTGWCVVGFTRPTLRVPEQFAAREHVLTFLAPTLDKNPDWESPAANFTAARTRALASSLTAADARYRSSRTRLRCARDARDDAVVELNRALRCLLKELSSLLKPADVRWLEFNLNQPIRRRKTRARAGAAVESSVAASAAVSAITTTHETRPLTRPPGTLPMNRKVVGQASSLPLGLPAPDPFTGRMPAQTGWKPAPLPCPGSGEQFVSFSGSWNLFPSGGEGRGEGDWQPFRFAARSSESPLHADEEELSETANAVPSASRRSWWNRLRAGAGKISWNLF